MVRVQVISDGDPSSWRTVVPGRFTTAPRCWGQWRPLLTLGAQPIGGLMLPDAHPSDSTLYAPRGVWIDPERVIVCDTGNHRVLIWNTWPQHSGERADVILGQPDAGSEGPNSGGSSAGMNLPTGVLVDPEGRLVVADAWNHRLLVWDTIPQGPAPPGHIIGQADHQSVEANRGGEPGADGFYWPFGIALIGERFYVCDTGNRRVLIWENGIPLRGEAADVVLGQPDFSSREENRGGEAGPCSFRWPHAISPAGTEGVFIADAGNHRVLRWSQQPQADSPADMVIGQDDFSQSSEFPYRSQEGHLRFPYAVTGPGLMLADTANNRVLIWEQEPESPGQRPDAVLAQRDFAANGENRWEQVCEDTLCWPYGLSRTGDLLAVADSGNNRVSIWQRQSGDPSNREVR